MDQFGVFTESYGLKPQGKSAPMAASKRQASSINDPKSTPRNSSSLNGSDTITQNYGGAGDGYDVFFGNLSDQPTTKSSFDYDSFFGGAKTSQFSGYDHNDDIFGGLNSSASAKLSDDVFASFGPNNGSSRDGGDLLGSFGDQPKASNPTTFGEAGLYDWSDGFGANMQTNQPRQPTNSTFMKSEDPFAVLESTSNTAYSSPDLFSAPLQENTHFNISGGTNLNVSSNASLKLRPPPKPSQVVKPDQVKSSYASEIDELEDFAMGGPGNNYNKEKLKIPTVSKKASNLGMGVKEKQNAKPSRDKVADNAAMKNQQKGEGDLESFFSMSTRSSSAPKSRNTSSVPNKKEPEGGESRFSGSSSNIKRASSETNLVDDLSSVFGASPMFGEFEEVDGESEERRRARMGRLKRTEERAAKALADMTQRDLQTQREQNERCRIAEIVDFDVKRWAAGKENNMRALLSSLHQVLWPECGWQPVSLTDMITSTSVKKVYRKATLCIHPDKVQQKGATLQQKYTAEKVFDILKEAWNKFNKEELS